MKYYQKSKQDSLKTLYKHDKYINTISYIYLDMFDINLLKQYLPTLIHLIGRNKQS